MLDTKKIISHHRPLDFDSFFSKVRSRYSGIDPDDIDTFAREDDRIHSYAGIADDRGDDRAASALRHALAVDDCRERIKVAKGVMIFIVHPAGSRNPLTLQEMRNLYLELSRVPDKCGLIIDTLDRQTTDDGVQAMVFINSGRE